MSRRGLFSLGAARLIPDRESLVALGEGYRNAREAAAPRAPADPRTPDPAALLARARRTWDRGDPALGLRGVEPAARALLDAAQIRPGDRVLDAAAGDGTLAAAAAAAGARVAALDLSPRHVATGRERCAAAGAEVEWHVGDVEALPFADASFDRTLSCFGAVYAPRPSVAAAELARVTRPGGWLGLAAWASSGFVSRVHALAAELDPPPPGAARPARWGRYESAFLWLGSLVEDFDHAPGELALGFESAGAAWETFSRAPGPLSAALRNAPQGARERARAAFAELVTAFGRPAGEDGLRIAAGYALVTGHVPGAL